MDEISNGLSRFWETLLEWVPKFIGALVIVLVAYIISKAIGGLVTRILRRAKLDDFLNKGRGGGYLSKIIPSMSYFIGAVVYWVLFIWGISIAVSVLGIPTVNTILTSVYNYIPNIIAAFLIFIIAGAIVAGVESFVKRVLGDTPTGKLIMAISPILIMGIAIFMILDQLKIASTIVTITYAALIGGIFLGLALAFGLGGREVAAQMLDTAYKAGQRQTNQAKRDVEVGKRRAEREARIKKQQNFNEYLE